LWEVWSSLIYGKGLVLYREPDLGRPDFMAAWPAIGDVALKAADFPKDTLKAEEFAEIERYIGQIRGEIQVERMLKKGERGARDVHS
jgi:hypothetical protein